MGIEIKTVVTVTEIRTLFNNRGSHTTVDANESSSLEIEKENSNNDGASESGEQNKLRLVCFMFILLLILHSPGFNSAY